jgi:hypothetical protein
LSLVGKALQPPFAERHESRGVLIAQLAQAASWMCLSPFARVEKRAA